MSLPPSVPVPPEEPERVVPQFPSAVPGQLPLHRQQYGHAQHSEEQPAARSSAPQLGHPATADQKLLSSGQSPMSPGHRQEPATADKRKRLNIILATLLVLALAATGYLVFLARSWSNQSAELDAISSDLGTQIAGLQSELNATTDNLTVAQEQLTKAQKRITELASEKALVGDDRESQRIIAEDTAQVAQEALTVSSQLGDCISAQTAHANLITTAQGKQHEIISELLKENPNMDAIKSTNESLTEMNTDISTQRTAANDACTGAVDRYNRLLDDLNQQ